MNSKRILVFEFINKLTSKNWIVTTFFIKISAAWYSLFLGLLGKYIYLTEIDENGEQHITTFGIIATIIVFLFSVIVSLSDRYKEVNNDIEKDYNIVSSERDLFQVVNNSVKDICKTKTNNQIQEIKRFRQNPKDVPFVYTKPCDQLKIITNEFTRCIAFLLAEQRNRIDKDDFTVNLIYNFPLESKTNWEWADSLSSVSLPKSKILAKDSTFSYLLKNDMPSYVFFNKKQEAYEQHHYIVSKNDQKQDGKLKGSIGCFYLQFGDNNNIYVRAVLSVSSCKKSFLNNSDFESESELKQATTRLADNIMNNLIDNYKYRIGVELCNYYIQYLYNKEHNPSN